MNKVRFLIPNLITACSLTCALVSLHFIYEDFFLTASWLIVASMFFDGLDGKVARLLQANSNFGAHFDTLSDFVAFGVTPGLLAYKSSLYQSGLIGAFICIFYVFCGGYRLVRFTIDRDTDTTIKHSFSGLPIPAAAGLLASFVMLQFHLQSDIIRQEFFILIILIASFLMISKIEYLAIEKRKKLTKEAIFFIGLAILSAVLSIWFSYLVFVGWIILYILYGLVRQVVRKRRME